MTIEFCVETYAEVLIAKKYGVPRVELCVALDLGGVTPSYGLVKKCCEIQQVEIHALIRPRTGNFFYDNIEIKHILCDIQNLKKAGISGIVIGVLNKDFTINQQATKEIVNLAKSLDLCVTFHRAFDVIKDSFGAIQFLKDINISRILTSGGHKNAQLGMENLKRYMEYANTTIEIMAGGGIRPHNVMSIIHNTNVDAIHFSISKKVQDIDTFSFGEDKTIDEKKIQEMLSLIKKNSV